MSNEFTKGRIKDNSKRKFSGGGPRPDRNDQKRSEAAERDKAWRRLSPEDQLASLNARLGKDVGATKQRARLQKLIQKEELEMTAPKQKQKREKSK